MGNDKLKINTRNNSKEANNDDVFLKKSEEIKEKLRISNNTKGSISAANVSNDEIATMIISLKSSMDEFKLSINESLRNLKQDVDNNMKKMSTDVDTKIAITNKNISVLESKNDYLEKQLIRKDIIITGVPYVSNEDVMTIVSNICDVISYDCTYAIDSAFRIRGPNVRPIIVKFCM